MGVDGGRSITKEVRLVGEVLRLAEEVRLAREGCVDLAPVNCMSQAGLDAGLGSQAHGDAETMSRLMAMRRLHEEVSFRALQQLEVAYVDLMLLTAHRLDEPDARSTVSAHLTGSAASIG